jgi:hypothetical protein
MSDRTVDAVDPENWWETAEFEQHCTDVLNSFRRLSTEEIDEIISMMLS